MHEKIDAELRAKLFSQLAIPLWPDWAKIMGFSRPFVHKMANEGRITGAFKTGRCWRVPTVCVRKQLMLEPVAAPANTSQAA